MSGVRLLTGCLAVVFLCVAASAWAAGQYLEMRFERAEYRAQGGVDIVLDPSTPANGALGGGLKARILSIDMYATVSEGRRAYKLGYVFGIPNFRITSIPTMTWRNFKRISMIWRDE